MFIHNISYHCLSTNIEYIIVISCQFNIIPFYLSKGFQTIKIAIAVIVEHLWEQIKDPVKNCINVVNMNDKNSFLFPKMRFHSESPL